jgi:hypothetical protein
MKIVSGTQFDVNNTVVENDLHKGVLQPCFSRFVFPKVCCLLVFSNLVQQQLTFVLLRLVMIARRQRQSAAMVWSCCLSRFWQPPNKKNWFPFNFWRQEELSWLPKDLYLAAVGSCTCEWSVGSWWSVWLSRYRTRTVHAWRQIYIATAPTGVKISSVNPIMHGAVWLRCFTWVNSQASALFLFSCNNSHIFPLTR